MSHPPTHPHEAEFGAYLKIDSELSPIARSWVQARVKPMVQPVLVPNTNNILYTEAMKAQAELINIPFLNTFIRSRQHATFQAPLQAQHPIGTILRSYKDNGFLTVVGPSWSLTSILAGIKKGPYTSTLSKEATTFCRMELAERSVRVQHNPNRRRCTQIL